MSFKNISGTYNTKFAVTLKCSYAVPCENVQIVDINLNNPEPASKKQGHFIVNGWVQDLQALNSKF